MNRRNDSFCGSQKILRFLQNRLEFLTRDVKNHPELWIIKKTTMENRLYKASATFACNCTNQLLLLPGCQCDLCMGVVAEYEPFSPEAIVEATDRYDQAYFEALERLYCSFEYAA